MSLSVLSPLPDPLRRVHEIQKEMDELRNQLDDAQADARTERRKREAMERGVGELRTVLSPLYQALAHIFGEIDVMGISEVASSPAASGVDPRKAAVWEDWKRKISPIAGRFIDALLLHGELTQTQLRLHAKCAAGSVPGVVSQLWKNGLINKNGGRISLKEL
jgi:hypothetical protein